MIPYVFLFVAIFIGIFSEIFKRHHEHIQKQMDTYGLDEYLMTEKDRITQTFNLSLHLKNNGKLKKESFNHDPRKPILWIPIVYCPNSRHWLSFHSRKTSELNQPYLSLTLQSIQEQGSPHFNIYYLHDEMIPILIEDWTLDLKSLPSPVQDHVRLFAYYKILYTYGGALIPPSYLALHPMRELWNGRDDFIASRTTRTLVSTYTNVFTNPYFLGCRRHSESMKSLLHSLSYIIHEDYTSEQDICAKIDKECYQLIQRGEMKYIDGKRIGLQTQQGYPVYIDHLLGSSSIDWKEEELHGILIPQEEILKRSKFEWFSHLSIPQLIESNSVLSDYIRVSIRN